jgi:hypothetical protein
MTQRRTALFAIVTVVLTTAPGCSLVSMGNDHRAVAEESQYAVGRGMREYANTPAVVRQAVIEAMTDLDMKPKRRAVEGTITELSGTTSNDQGISVVIRPVRNQTRVTCRIGWFGDGPQSIALLDRVSIRLGDLPPAPIPSQVPSAPSANPFFSRDAVSDEEMLRDAVDAPYRDRVIP